MGTIAPGPCDFMDFTSETFLTIKPSFLNSAGRHSNRNKQRKPHASWFSDCSFNHPHLSVSHIPSQVWDLVPAAADLDLIWFDHIWSMLQTCKDHQRSHSPEQLTPQPHSTHSPLREPQEPQECSKHLTWKNPRVPCSNATLVSFCESDETLPALPCAMRLEVKNCAQSSTILLKMFEFYCTVSISKLTLWRDARVTHGGNMSVKFGKRWKELNLREPAEAPFSRIECGKIKHSANGILRAHQT